MSYDVYGSYGSYCETYDYHMKISEAYERDDFFNYAYFYCYRCGETWVTKEPRRGTPKALRLKVEEIT